METATHEGRSRKLVGGNVDEKGVAARRYCAELVACFLRFSSGTEKFLQPGVGAVEAGH